MEKVNARRGFLKGFGLLSAVVAGASAPILANTSTSSSVRNTDNPVLTPPVDKALAPLGQVNLVLTADNNPPPPPPPVSSLNGCYLMAGVGSYSPMMSYGNLAADSKKNNVKMSVGRDDRLWIEVDGEWRRVALEG